MPSIVRLFGLVLVLGALAGPVFAQDVVREDVPGIRNLARIGTTIACAGAITPEAAPDIAAMGFRSVLNLRREGEEGNDVQAARAAAEAAGLRYIHIPYDGSADAAVARRFLDAVTDEANEPVFVHCASGNRAASLWMIKRIAVDGWDVARATEEAVALGSRSEAMQAFAAEFGLANRR